MPIDFSAAANAVLATAIRWDERFYGELHLVHVYSGEHPASALMVAPLVVPDSQVAADIRSHLEGVVEDHGLRMERVTLHVRKGRPYEEICRLARQLDVDLIMTADRGRTGLTRLALGSTAERIVRYTPCPVLVVHPPPVSARRFPPALRKILVPTDFSTCAEHGLTYARALAAEFRARLILLHSVDLDYCNTSPEYTLFDLPPLLAAAEKAGRDQMQKVIRETDWRGLKVECILENGHAGEEICRRACELGADLIVTSTHGRSGSKRVLVGSTAEYIVRHATCPVLVVPTRRRPALPWRKGAPYENHPLSRLND